MVAITAPIRLRAAPEALASAAPYLDAAEGTVVLSELAELVERLCVLRDSYEEAVGDVVRMARRLRRLGIMPELSEPISNINRQFLKWTAVGGALEEGHRTLGRIVSGNDGAHRGAVLEAAQAMEKQVATIRKDLMAYLESLKAEQALPPPADDKAPIDRAFRVYCRALADALAPYGPGGMTVEVCQVEGDVIPVLRVELDDTQDRAAIIDREQLAHDAVEAQEPSIVGFFAIDYVRPAASA